MSDTVQPSRGIVNLILAIPEMVLELIQYILALPAVLLKWVLQLTLGVAGTSGGKSSVGNKGKSKGSKSPIKKRVSVGRMD
jgi:hypothetical protein